MWVYKSAVRLVHLYGQSADIEPILAACEPSGGWLGCGGGGISTEERGAAIFSFNGNKVLATCWCRMDKNGITQRVPDDADTRRFSLIY
ncbi:MAG: hypothetical protein ACPGWR_00175 [Ardenticatenaceae bacterium]